MIDGLVVVDKPAGWTSHDVVARCRRIFSQRRVGHAGTLDPDATGVLLVGLGRATRLMRYLSGLGKVYSGELVLGVATSTLDASGVETGRWDMSGVTLAEARVAAQRLTGPILQIPPMVSALKVGGRRLHELAREGKEVERAARPVHVARFDLEDMASGDAGPGATHGTDPTASGPAVVGAPAVGPGAGGTPVVGPPGGGPVFRFVVECSSGTYVRTLVADLGAALGGGAYLRVLRRCAVGSFLDADAVPLESLGLRDVIDMAGTVRHLASVSVDAETARAVGHGKVVERQVLSVDGEGPWAVLDAHGALLAVYEPTGPSLVKPAVVVAPEEGSRGDDVVAGGDEPRDLPGGAPRSHGAR